MPPQVAEVMKKELRKFAGSVEFGLASYPGRDGVRPQKSLAPPLPSRSLSHLRPFCRVLALCRLCGRINAVSPGSFSHQNWRICKVDGFAPCTQTVEL